MTIESKLQGFADDLEQVTDKLAHGVNEVKAVERALRRSREALMDSEAALTASRNAGAWPARSRCTTRRQGCPTARCSTTVWRKPFAGADRHGRMLAVMFLDLDRFKLVNDTHGHAAGDSVLEVVAQRLMRNARDEDTVCRNGGDEFLYLQIDPTGREEVARIAELVRQAIEEPIGLGALQFAIRPSIGIALYPAHGASRELLIAHADAAMYRAKQLSSHCEFYDPPKG